MQKYCCVSCGTRAPALTRSYGPTVLKLATCTRCGNVVDKYIEYDPVIVMIDLILITRAAQSHILHNTNFEIFWKLFIFLILLETYGVCCKNNIMNLCVDAICGKIEIIETDIAEIEIREKSHTLLETVCQAWDQDVRINDNNPFLREKKLYIVLASISIGTCVFACVIHVLSRLMRTFLTITDVSVSYLLKTITIGNIATLFSLPLIVWGIADDQARSLHVLLVFAYTYLVSVNALSVMYSINIGWGSGILLISYILKFITVFISKYVIELYA